MRPGIVLVQGNDHVAVANVKYEVHSFFYVVAKAVPQSQRLAFRLSCKMNYICPMEKTEIKFRLLSQEEFMSLEKDFVLYLAARGITEKEWQAIKSRDDEQLFSILGDFSNMVWCKILSGKEYMEYTASGYRYLLHFRQNETEMFRFSMEPPFEMGHRTTQRPTSAERAMFEALEGGASFCDKAVFEEGLALYKRHA